MPGTPVALAWEGVWCGGRQHGFCIQSIWTQEPTPPTLGCATGDEFNSISVPQFPRGFMMSFELTIYKALASTWHVVSTS